MAGVSRRALGNDNRGTAHPRLQQGREQVGCEPRVCVALQALLCAVAGHAYRLAAMARCIGVRCICVPDWCMPRGAALLIPLHYRCDGVPVAGESSLVVALLV